MITARRSVIVKSSTKQEGMINLSESNAKLKQRNQSGMVRRHSKTVSWKKDLIKNYDLYLISLPALAIIILFAYVPMYGIQIAFKDFVASKGIWGSAWVGLEHFRRLFSGYNFVRIIKNTLTLSCYTLIMGFPLPILFAIMLNEVKQKWFTKTMQMVSYAPNFISTVVMVGMLMIFLDPSTGIFNVILGKLGFDSIGFLTEPRYFKHIYVWSEIWQTMGYNAIIYIAALSGIDPQLHEAATIDGATKLQKIIHVDIPGIASTAVILLILNAGKIMNVGFDKVFLLQNDLNREAADIIATYTYRIGILGAEYSFSTAVGLFNSVINCILLVTVNAISKKIGDTSLW